MWGSAWDAARDGETPARGYVDLILANIAAEIDSSVILVQLRQLATTLNFYVAEEHREATQVAAADRSGSSPRRCRAAPTPSCSS